MGEADSENFDRWVERTFGDEIDKTLLTRVAGVTFDNEDGSSRQTLIQQCRKYQRLNLVAEPKNKYDHAAVRVETKTGKCLGYVPRNFNLPFGPDRWLAVVRDVHLAERGKSASLVICILRKVAGATSE